MLLKISLQLLAPLDQEGMYLSIPHYHRASRTSLVGPYQRLEDLIMKLESQTKIKPMIPDQPSGSKLIQRTEVQLLLILDRQAETQVLDWELSRI